MRRMFKNKGTASTVILTVTVRAYLEFGSC